MRRCSIVILNWNGAEMLRRYLPSVVRYCPSDCEVVVADNGSTDESLEILRQEFSGVRLITLPENYGFAEGYNKALEYIESEYVVLLNSDVEVTEGWLSPLLDYLASHADVAAVQPKIRAWYDKTLFEHAGAAGGFIDRLGYPYCRGRIMSELEQDHGQYDTPTDIFWATGACFVTRTALYKEVGGLDADFFAHMEEIDLCWRLHSRGYRIMCLPSSVVYHLGGGALPYESPRKTYLNFRNSLFLLYKNTSTARLMCLMPLRCLLDYTAALQFFVKGECQNARAVVSARRDYHHMRTQMRAKRRKNMSLTVNKKIAEQRPFSIVLRYFLLRQRRFSELNLKGS